MRSNVIKYANNDFYPIQSGSILKKMESVFFISVTISQVTMAKLHNGSRRLKIKPVSKLLTKFPHLL